MARFWFCNLLISLSRKNRKREFASASEMTTPKFPTSGSTGRQKTAAGQPCAGAPGMARVA